MSERWIYIKKRKSTEEGISKNRTKSTLDLEQTEKYECGEL